MTALVFVAVRVEAEPDEVGHVAGVDVRVAKPRARIAGGGAVATVAEGKRTAVLRSPKIEYHQTWSWTRV